MCLLYLTSVWLHVLSEAVWIGGMTFLVLALVPALKRPQYKDVASSLVQITGVRFRTMGWITMGVLVMTGFFNLYVRKIGLAELLSADLWQTSFGRALGIKLFLVLIVLIMSAFHDFYVGPKATAAWLHNDEDQATRLRRQARWFGRTTLILGLTVLAMAVTLVRGGYGPRAGKERVPIMRDMYDSTPATWALQTLVTGIALVVTGRWLGWMPAAQIGAIVVTVNLT